MFTDNILETSFFGQIWTFSVSFFKNLCYTIRFLTNAGRLVVCSQIMLMLSLILLLSVKKKQTITIPAHDIFLFV